MTSSEVHASNVVLLFGGVVFHPLTFLAVELFAVVVPSCVLLISLLLLGGDCFLHLPCGWYCFPLLLLLGVGAFLRLLAVVLPLSYKIELNMMK